MNIKSDYKLYFGKGLHIRSSQYSESSLFFYLLIWHMSFSPRADQLHSYYHIVDTETTGYKPHYWNYIMTT